MSDIGTVVFYSIEKAIKTYRQFAQHRLVEAGSRITVDQWLVLNVIESERGIQQGRIADLVFKDKASIARMIDLLVQADLVVRSIPPGNRRSVQLALTRKGRKQLKVLTPIVRDYRKQALKGVSIAEVKRLESTLRRIMSNCHE